MTDRGSYGYDLYLKLASIKHASCVAASADAMHSYRSHQLTVLSLNWLAKAAMSDRGSDSYLWLASIKHASCLAAVANAIYK